VAGGGKDTSIGDVVVGSSYLQHDLDLRPIFSQFHIFSLNTQLIHAKGDLVARMKFAAEQFFQKNTPFSSLGITSPKVHEGVIVSGDQFINNLAYHEKIVESVKDLLPDGFHAIEMEGAAVAQVCQEMGIPFVVVRSISDKANQEAAGNFELFMDQAAGVYSLGILKEYLSSFLVR